MEPLVSVIMPTYNGAAWLAASVESVLTQTYRHLELILVDDGSTDETRSMIDTLVAHDARVRAVYKTNGGVASARNAGLAAARGEYIAFLDQDDRYAATKLASQVAFLAQHPAVDLVYGRHLIVDQAGRILREQPERPWTTFRELWGEHGCFHTGSTLICRRILDAVGPLNERIGWGDDLELVLRIAQRGTIAFVDDGVIFYHVRHEHNTSGGDDERLFYRYTLQALSSLGPAPEHGVTWRQFRRRMARLHYCLARLEREVGSFRAAAYHFWQALRWHPAVGILVPMEPLTPAQAAWQILKAYGAFMASLAMACIMSPGPRARAASRRV